MRVKSTPAFLVSLALALSGAAAQGQASPSTAQGQGGAPQASHQAAPYGGFDLAGSFLRSFNTSTTGTGTVQTPTDADGALVEGRYISSPLLGIEMAFSFNGGSTTFAPKQPPPQCNLVCADPVTTLTNNVSIVSLDWVPSMTFGRLRPFAVAGVGILIDYPGASTYAVNDVTRPDWVLGGGVDWSITGHWGVRLQYRDNFYKAPNISFLYPATGQFAQTAQPMGGVFYRF